MADKPIEATVRETKESPYAVEVVVDGHAVKSDEPSDSGGKNLAPYPHEILVAALGACTAQTVRWYAARHDIPLESVDVALTYRRDRLEGHSGLVDIFTKELHFEGATLTPEQRAKLLDVAEKCPIQRLLEATPVIHTSEREPAN
jgi:putative redox protein